MTNKIILAVLLSLVVVLAGCVGGGPGPGEDGTTTTQGSDGGDGASDGGDGASDGGDGTTPVIDPTEDDGDWFNLSKAGLYEFEIKQLNEETGELETGYIKIEVSDVEGNVSTVKWEYKLGGDESTSQLRRTSDDVIGQTLFTPAGTVFWTLQVTPPLLYWGEMGFSDPAVGNKNSETENGTTRVTEVTEQTSIAGVEAFMVESTVDGQLDHKYAIVSGFEGTSPYYAEYDEETGDLITEIRLVSFERR